MSQINILLWYNDHNPQSSDFVKGFEEDVHRCLVRFRSTSTVRVNENWNEGDCCIVILSLFDTSDAQFLSSVRDLLTKANTHLVTIDKVDENSLNLGNQRQPFLFWDKQLETGEIRPFRRDSVLTKSNYWEKVTDVVVDITSNISKRAKEAQKKYVYISLDDVSHNADRENLQRDLNDLGFEIVPSKSLSSNFEECTSQIESALKESVLIINIIPPIYNIHFADHHLSLTEHQCNVSANFLRNEDSEVKRIIWISSAYDITDEENQVFIEKVQRDQDQAINTTVLKTSIEDLKKHYRQILSIKSEEVVKQKTQEEVYIVMDGNQDNGTEQKIKDVLGKQNVGVVSNFSGISYSQHLKQLARSRVVVVCYNAENKEWLAVKANDILKSKGIDSALPFSKIVLVKSNNNFETKAVENIFTDVISDFHELSSIRIAES